MKISVELETLLQATEMGLQLMCTMPGTGIVCRHPLFWYERIKQNFGEAALANKPPDVSLIDYYYSL
jgi:hypothetical protein